MWYTECLCLVKFQNLCMASEDLPMMYFTDSFIHFKSGGGTNMGNSSVTELRHFAAFLCFRQGGSVNTADANCRWPWYW